jgi:hypothetical protein
MIALGLAAQPHQALASMLIEGLPHTTLTGPIGL